MLVSKLKNKHSSYLGDGFESSLGVFLLNGFFSFSDGDGVFDDFSIFGVVTI